jgi:glutaredoxin
LNISTRSLLGLVLLVVAAGAAQRWWTWQQGQTLGSDVATLVQPGDIRMLSSETCGYCLQARLWFQANDIAFSECLIERDAACRAEFQALRAPGTPVIVVRGRAQIGFSAARVRQALLPA